MRGHTPTVLVVDDEPAIADGQAARLEADYSVRTAYDGAEALEVIDDEVDVVLLDRKMPNLGGVEAVERIREAGYDCRVAMLTGVEPGMDILEMGFDEYLTKPVSKEDLFDVVERMLRRARYDRVLQEFFALASKAATLETRYDPEVLASNPEYQSLREDIETLREDVDDALAQLPKKEQYSIASMPGQQSSSDAASN